MLKNKVKLKRYIALVLIVVLMFSTCVTSHATESKSELEKAISTLQSEISSINGELIELAEEQVLIEDQIVRTQDEMVKTQLALEENKKKEIEQYESMKLRIRYMYEEGQTSLLEILFGAESLVDFINKTEFVNNVTEYDKNMLSTLVEISKKIEFEEENLIAQEQVLLVLEENNNAIKAELEIKAKATSTDLSSVQGKLTALKKAEAEAAAAEAAAKAAAAKAAEEAAAAEANKNNQSSGTTANGTASNGDTSDNNTSSGTTTNGSTSSNNTSNGTTTGSNYAATTSELDLMAALLDCEAISNYNAMLAVATVIMNRVSDSRFPNTISGVIYQTGQFSPTWTGKLNRVLASGASSLAYRAAEAAVGGSRYSTVSHCYFFQSAAYTAKKGINVGGNIFFVSW